MDSYYVFILFLGCMIDVSMCGSCTYSKTCMRTTKKHCGAFGWARCEKRVSYTCYYSDCCSGWRGSSCTTPICSTPCYNGGTCVSPNKCSCPTSHSGTSCMTLLCSHKSPCYPGTCSYPHSCSCFTGFSDASSGCLTFSSNNSAPVISTCETTLARIRRTDHKQLFSYPIPCSGRTGKDTVWSNQQLFNYATFTMSSFYSSISNLPPVPAYISAKAFGIVYNAIQVEHSKHPRPGDSRRFTALDKVYRCSGVSDNAPEENTAMCKIVEQNYKINIEHNDILTITYTTKSGGYRQLYDRDSSRNYTRQAYKGRTVNKAIEFRFDFIAPVHCSELSFSTNCRKEPIYIGDDITKNKINITTSGWSDALSGIAYYYLELFQLKPNRQNELTEVEPLKPIFTYKTLNTRTVKFPAYTPPQTGMYSILLQASDKANNSKIARRLVLYDNNSSITLIKLGMLSGAKINASDTWIGDGGMHVISAVPETGFLWQTTRNGAKINIVLDWENHFVNKMYEQGKLLNKVLPYPTQFADLADNGILRSKKYVSMDDDEGMRTVNAIPNIHGIVKFEIKRVYTDNKQVPVSGWVKHSLSERYKFQDSLHNGRFVRIWVRATDIMNHTLADYTEVHVDNTAPRLANIVFKENVENGTHNHTSRITFMASDDGSGVDTIEYSLFVGNSTVIHEKGSVLANRNNAPRACLDDPRCTCVLNTCFLREQTLDVDNCWFLVPKDDLNKSARIDIKVYNQALLYDNFSVQINRLTDLSGLEHYSGPSNIRLEEKHDSGVRVAWDLPQKASCYGRADMNVILVDSQGSVKLIHVHEKETFIDLVGLKPDNDYTLSLKLGYRGTELAAAPYEFKTAPKENYLAGGVIAGIITSGIALICVLVAIFVLLVRRGHMKSVRGGLVALTGIYRKTDDTTEITEHPKNNKQAAGNIVRCHEESMEPRSK